MTEYIVLLPGNETEWAKADEAERARVYGKHQEFAAALAERGHKVTGGAELAQSTEAKTVRRTGGSVAITDGPYAETVEQLTGYYTDRRATTSTTCSSASASSPRARAAVEVRRCLEM